MPLPFVEIQARNWSGETATVTIAVVSHEGRGSHVYDDEFVERVKQLDLEHLSRSFGTTRAILSLGLLRRLWQRLWTPPLEVTPAPVARPAPGSLTLTSIGHATVLITSATVRTLVDPMFGNWLGCFRRARAAAIRADDIADVDLVLICNAHKDRLSRASLARLPRAATLVVPPGCGSRIADLGFSRLVELRAGDAFTHADSEIRALPVRPPKTHPRRSACGYLFTSQGRKIYLAGETAYFDGFRDIGRRYAPDVAVLPIAGYQPAALRRHRMSPLDAVYAFEDLRAGRLIPIAFGSFDVGYEPIDHPESWFRELVHQRGWEAVVTILRNGQSCLLP